MELLKTKCFSSMIFSFKNILTLFFKPIRLSKVVRYKSAAGTRRPEDVPCRSRKGPNVRYLQGTFRSVSGDQYKNEKKKKKLRIYSSFLQEEQIFKCSQRGRPRDVYGNKLQYVPGTKWWAVVGTSTGCRSNMFFKFNSQTH